MSIHQRLVTPGMTELEAIKTKDDALKLPFNQKSPLARAAWSADPDNPPLFLDLPGKDGKPRPVVAAKWMANSLMVMLQQYPAHLRKIKAIEMNVGTQDALLEQNREMDSANPIPAHRVPRQPGFIVLRMSTATTGEQKENRDEQTPSGSF